MFSLLQVGEPLSQPRDLVVVEERDGADHHPVADLVPMGDERAVQDRSDGLRPAGKAALLDHRVEFAEDLLGQG